MGNMKTRQDLLPGTLDMLILKSLTRGVMHGYGIVEHIRTMSDEVLKVEEGSLYPALQRLQLQGLDRFRVGTFGQQPARPLLPADRGRAPAARAGRVELRAADRGDRAGHETGRGRVAATRLLPKSVEGTKEGRSE